MKCLSSNQGRLATYVYQEGLQAFLGEHVDNMVACRLYT